MTTNAPSRMNANIDRLRSLYLNAIQIHTPVHASWLNQVEIYFSVLQRKVLCPNDFESLEELKRRIIDFQVHNEKIAKPFEWKFTREDLKKILSKCNEKQKLAA